MVEGMFSGIITRAGELEHHRLPWDGRFRLYNLCDGTMAVSLTTNRKTRRVRFMVFWDC